MEIGNVIRLMGVRKDLYFERWLSHFNFTLLKQGLHLIIRILYYTSWNMMNNMYISQPQVPKAYKAWSEYQIPKSYNWLAGGSVTATLGLKFIKLLYHDSWFQMEYNNAVVNILQSFIVWIIDNFTICKSTHLCQYYKCESS